MNDLEDRLRADFRQATAGVEDTVDAEAALLAGQRARSSRRIGTTIGITALAAVAGLVGWTVLRVVPIQRGVPSPLETISAVPSPPGTEDPMSTTFDLSSEGFSGKGPHYDSITFKVLGQTARSYRGTVTLAEAGHPKVTKDFSAPFGKSWDLPWDRHLLIGAVPGNVSWFSIISRSSQGVFSNQQQLEGVGMTVFWAYFEEADGPGWAKGFLWETAEGAVRDSAGKAVPSARIALKDQSYLVYRDEDLDIIGIRASGDSSSYSNRISDSKPSDLVQGGMGRENDDGTSYWTQYGALPPGAHDVKVELSDAGGDWAATAMSDGWVAVVANSPHAANTGDVIRSITYLDADGVAVTYHS